ncbi:coth protein-domain-containing protein, partial [Cokeromyces recurvatus]|uniref:coth protein-domain-containing protein n=1 Tax=Cokeromyces recurvatus TaxID=90255 RepID=UPI0022207C9B
MILKRIGLSALFVALAAAQQQNITYNVITSPAANDMSVFVVVDNVTYPLSTNSSESLLYSGKAPIAAHGYYYAIMDNTTMNATEAFIRSPTHDNTVNEFFNRSSNVYSLTTLPQLYEPLHEIDRLDSPLHILNQIPTIHLWGNESAIDNMHERQTEDITIRLNMTYYSLNDTQTFKDVKVSLAGRSSRFAPKLSYSLKMPKKDKQSLYGYKNLKLRASAYDPSYIRECIAYSTLNAVGIPASGYSYVRLFINKRPIGLYGLIETFQDPWLANEFDHGNPHYKPGVLYQGQALAMNESIPLFSDLSYYENRTWYTMGQYKIKAGIQGDETSKDYKDLQEFTKFIDSANKSTTTKEWEKHINTVGFIRAMAIENLLGFSDAYMTLADNFYVYSNPKEDGKMTYIPADLDTTIGISLFDKRLMLSGNYSEHPGFHIRPLTKKLFANDHLLNSLQYTMYNLTRSLINPNVMFPFIDSVVNMIHPDVEWDQSLPRVAKAIKFPFSVLNSTDRMNTTMNFIPSGFTFNFTSLSQTFDQAINDSIDSTVLSSVKGFISQKSSNILEFYKSYSFII